MEGQDQITNYLVGPRVKLVKFTDRHITAPYIGWLNNHKVNRYLCTGRLPVANSDVNVPAGDKNLLYAMLSKLRLDSGDKIWASDNYDNYIGTISLHDIDWIARRGEVGYMIGEQSHWGIGIATEIIGLVANHGFNRLNLNKITAGVVDGNTGSIKALEKNGFKQYGTNPQDYYLEGKYLDVHRFYKLREWLNA